jgi:hypothetical protein
MNDLVQSHHGFLLPEVGFGEDLQMRLVAGVD